MRVIGPSAAADRGVFARILLEFARQSDPPAMLMIDATHLKTHRTVSSLRLKNGGAEGSSGAPRGVSLRTNSELHAVTDNRGRPIRMYLSADQTSDYIGARALVAGLLAARSRIGDMTPTGSAAR